MIEPPLYIRSGGFIFAMKKIYRIYRYTNILNGMKYYGTTSRKYQSERAGKNGSRYIKMCRRFGEAILEHGWPNFKYEVIEDGLTREEALERERYWIEKENSIWPNGYNLEAGGKKGHSVNEDTKKRMSESSIGKKMSDSSKKKNRLSHINNPNLSKIVRQYTLDGQFVKEYPSASEASRQTGLSQGNISMCCRGERNMTDGFIWKYV